VNILIVTATEGEISLLKSGPRGQHTLDVLVTGVGMVATAARTAQALGRGTYDLALNLGVCGSFDPAYAPGTVVHVTRDRISELGCEDGEEFLPIEQLGLGAEGDVITVNTVHGSEQSIAAVLERFRPEVESMEGAAFAYACDISDIAYAQVRAVSNIVERRNRKAWKLDVAIRNLNDAAIRILDAL
jgi:futalosine hydrolase